MSTYNTSEPLAYCSKCNAWRPMEWQPQNERKKNHETWFKCAVCGASLSKFRYIYRQRQ